MTDSTQTPPLPADPFSADDVTLFGTPIAGGKSRVSTGDGREATMVVSGTDATGDLTLAAVLGYAFEGACYRFARPRTMAFRPREALAADGCGFGEGYTMWRLDRRAGVISVQPTGGALQEMLIEAHSEDDRSPATYASKMVQVHRHSHA